MLQKVLLAALREDCISLGGRDMTAPYQQKRLINALQFLADGNCVAICTELGRSLGKMSFSKSPTFAFTYSIVSSLCQYGFLNVLEDREYGIRWCFCTISPKGLKVLEEEKSK